MSHALVFTTIMKIPNDVSQQIRVLGTPSLWNCLFYLDYKRIYLELRLEDTILNMLWFDDNGECHRNRSGLVMNINVIVEFVKSRCRCSVYLIDSSHLCFP